MITKFDAAYIFTQSDNDMAMVGFADKQFETEKYLLLQRSISDLHQNKEIGLNEVHITYNEQSRSTYGGIQKCILYKSGVEIHLDSNTAAKLDTAKKIEIGFIANSAEIDAIQTCLQLLFIETPEVFMIAT
jgi:hypothetical protein